METLFIEARYREKFLLAEEVISKLPDKIRLSTTIQYFDSLEGIKAQLEKAGKQVSLFNSTHTKYPGQILGCSIDKEDGDFAYLYVGDGMFHPKSLAYTSDKEVYTYNPLSKQLSKISEEDIEKIKKLKQAALVKYSSSDSIGIIVTIKPGQNQLKRAMELKDKLQQDSKEAYVFMCDTLDFNELENFPFVDCWVNTMCPRIGYDDVVRTEKRIVNIGDVAKTCKTKPELSKEAIKAIERARERIKKGKFLTASEAKKRLGF